MSPDNIPLMLKRPRREDLRELLRLALPVTGVQLGLMLMGVIDTIMVGHVSATALAAAALGNLYFFAVMVFGMGVLMVLDPLVSQGVGAGDRRQVRLAMQRGLLLALGLAVVASIMCLPARALFTLMGQPREVIPIAVAFLNASIPGMLPFLLFFAGRQSLQAMKHTRPIVACMIAGNVLNAGLNLVLVFGHLGAPALGAVGSAWASTVSRTVMSALLYASSWGILRPAFVPFERAAFEGRALWGMVRLGVPIGIQTALEFGVFALVALLMGRLGATTMAAHQVAINLASFTYMVPLGVSSAAAVLVGQAVGRGDGPGVARVAASALACGVGFMACTALAFTLAPRAFASLYTTDPAVLATAVLLLPLAGVFQVFDGAQAVCAGVLRGAGETRTPMIVNAIGFWAIGLPFGLWLGFGLGLGGVGLWWGLVLGLAAVAVILLLRLIQRLRLGIERVRMEPGARQPAGTA